MKNKIRKTNNNAVLKIIAKVTEKSADFFANTACVWWNYQPKKPEAVKKLRRF